MGSRFSWDWTSQISFFYALWKTRCASLCRHILRLPGDSRFYNQVASPDRNPRDLLDETNRSSLGSPVILSVRYQFFGFKCYLFNGWFMALTYDICYSAYKQVVCHLNVVRKGGLWCKKVGKLWAGLLVTQLDRRCNDIHSDFDSSSVSLKLQAGLLYGRSC